MTTENLLFIVRHGRSTGNKNSAYYGYPDSCVCLTDEGIDQAIESGEFIKQTLTDYNANRQIAVFTSALSRAKQTARISCDVAGITAPHTENMMINERYHSADYVESYEDATHRIVTWFNNTVDPLLSSSSVIIYAHGEILKGLQWHLCGYPEWKFLKVVDAPAHNACPYVYRKKSGRYEFVTTYPDSFERSKKFYDDASKQ